MSNQILEWQGGRLDFSDGCIVMGILNVTPDSFSDGGEFLDVEKAVAHGIEMARDGAAIIDIGPESTRPGAERITSEEQIRRAVGVIEKLVKKVDVPISIDTTDVDVAAAAINAGAGIVNDVSALSDTRMAELVCKHDLPIVLMHMLGTPETMQVEPDYDDVVSEVLEFLLGRAKLAEDYGVAKDKIFIDPGIGFGKTLEHNLQLLRNVDKFIGTGYRVLLGTSRKRFIGALTGQESPANRMFGTAATVAMAASAGVSIVRVHDVAQMVDVVKVAAAIAKQSN